MAKKNIEIRFVKETSEAFKVTSSEHRAEDWLHKLYNGDKS